MTNKTSETKSLAEIVSERRGTYETQMNQAFNAVYLGGNISYICEFEQVVSSLSSRAIEGASLEGFVSGVKIRTSRAKPQASDAVAPVSEAGAVADSSADTRPRLTFYQYAKSRDSGMTNEQIKAKFRIDNPYQMGGFGKKYASGKSREQLEALPVLTKEAYCKSRDAGMTNEEIRESFRIKDARAIGGLSAGYAKRQREFEADPRQALTFEAYSAERKAGLNNEQIKEKYKTTSRSQLSAFAGNYSRYVAKGSQKKTEKKLGRPSRFKRESRPELTREEYARAQQQGLDRAQIMEQYNTTHSQITGFGMQYRLREKLKASEIAQQASQQEVGQPNPAGLVAPSTVNVEANIVAAVEPQSLQQTTGETPQQ